MTIELYVIRLLDRSQKEWRAKGGCHGERLLPLCKLDRADTFSSVHKAEADSQLSIWFHAGNVRSFRIEPITAPCCTPKIIFASPSGICRGVCVPRKCI